MVLVDEWWFDLGGVGEWEWAIMMGECFGVLGFVERLRAMFGGDKSTNLATL